MRNKKSLWMLYLVVSMLFVMPLNFASVMAGDNSGSGSSGGSGKGKDYVSKAECSNNRGIISLKIEDSILLSAISLCLPGILKNLQKWRQIQCKAILCYYNSILKHVDPSFCRDLEEYQECSMVFNQFLFVEQLFGRLRKLIDQILKDPTYLGYKLVEMGARWTYNYNCESDGGSTYACWGSAIVTAAFDIPAAIQTIKTIPQRFENMVKETMEGEDYCDKVEDKDIKKEVDEILKYNKEGGSNENGE